MTQPLSLWDKIDDAKTSSEYPYKVEFWPEGSLGQITEHDIIMELYGYLANRARDAVDLGLVQFILTYATKLLAACYISQIRNQNLGQTMSFFRNRGLSDRNLPFEQAIISQCATYLPWTRPQMTSFLQYQWKFVAQQFPMDRCLVSRILPEIILPFIQASPLGRGNFGDVFKVVVHPSHFDEDDPVHQVRHQSPCYSIFSAFTMSLSYEL